MTALEINMTASCILKVGPIIYLSNLTKRKKTGLLIYVSSMSDVSFIFNKFFITDATLALDKNKINILGKISFAAIQGTPLLILMSNSGTDFIQISKLKSIIDEYVVQKPCQFKLLLNDQSLSFACYTSTDYTEWIDALRSCHEQVLMPILNSNYSYSMSEIDQREQNDEESLKEQLEVVRIASHLTFTS
jgi:hypothetical protein